jgi:hypothetical protein
MTNIPMNTPWGIAQTQDKVAEGIIFVTTASHGGFCISPEVHAKMPKAYQSTFAHAPNRDKNFWYEEDCDYAKVILSFPDMFMAKEVEVAKKMIEQYFPESHIAAKG